MDRLELNIDGMTCAACVRRVETVLKKVPGVTEAHVNLAARRASIQAPHALITEELKLQLVAAVQKAGYEGTIEEPDTTPKSLAHKSQLEIRDLKRQFIIAALLTLPVFVMEMGGHMIPALHHALSALIPMGVQHIISAVLTTLVLAWPGRHFFTQGLKALFQAQPEMNSLVAVGAGSAWVYSMVVLIAPELVPEASRHVYFEAAAVIVTLILLGRLFEARARGNTGAAIEHLIGLQPRTARIIEDGQDKDVPIESVKPGDLLRVRPGEKIPVDGVVVDGEPYIDMAMITGEPIPVGLKAGDSVAGGTLNTTVGFTFKATHTGSDTMLARIIRMVQSAQDAKLPIQAVVDKVTAVFVPVIMVIALITFVTWFALTGDVSAALVSAVAVLIIACPCAMGLATPTSIMVGTGRAAQLGILFRQGDALQQLQHVTTVAFDKTGTLTQGHPTLTHIHTISPQFDAETLLRIVAALQTQSEHPIARAIVDAVKDRVSGQEVALIAKDFKAIKGQGVTATVQCNGQLLSVAVGSAALMQSFGARALDPGALDQKINDWARQGHTPVHVAVGTDVVGALAVSDPIKPEAKETIHQLTQRGIACAMITGDHPLTAQAVAQELGIKIVHAQVKPDEKVQAIEPLMKKGSIVAFVGDGINDAPALAAADVGIAIGTGTDVAIEAASVVLMSGNLAKVVTALDVSKATLRNIHQNLFWAFGYNVALVPVAAGVLYPVNGTLLSPMLAAAAMGFSSVFVVTNALRLRFLKASG
jgi:heavy metal translocating P-type ATPase